MKRFVKFNQDGFVNGELVFKKDETYSFETHTSADRWIARGNTEVSEKDSKAPAKKEVAPPTPPKPPVAPPKDDKKKLVADDEDGL